MGGPLLVCAAVAAVSAAPPADELKNALDEPAMMVTTPILRTRVTTSGQPLRLPQGDSELVAVAVEIPAGGATSIHQHPWSRFAYVEKGQLRVVNHDTGEAKDFRPGEVLSEAVGQWHEGRAIDGPVRLIVFDLVPPGVTNVSDESAKKE